MTRHRISNMPAVTWEFEVIQGDEHSRRAVYLYDRYLGDVIYVQRRHAKGGSTWGHRPAKSHPNSALTDISGAVARLICPHGFPGPDWHCCREDR